MTYVALTYARVDGVFYTPGEVFDAELSEDARGRLMAHGAIRDAEDAFARTAPARGGNDGAGGEAAAPPADEGEYGDENAADEGEYADDPATDEDEPGEDAPPMEIDPAGSVVTADDKPKRKKRGGAK